MPYHFGEVYENPDKFYGIEKRKWSCQNQDVVHIKLIPDDDAPAGTPPLIMEFYNEHNGFYSHDFSIEQIKE